MRIRNILICVLTSLLCLGFFCPKAANAAQTPQEFVKKFYEWYLIKDYDLSDALKQDKLAEYVDEELIAELREEEKCHEMSYFTQMGPFFIGFKNAKVHVGGVLHMTNDVFVVPATITKESIEKIVIVYVHKKTKHLKFIPSQTHIHTNSREYQYEKDFSCLHASARELVSSKPSICPSTRCKVFCA